jgi:hypothetical protein
LIAEAALDDVDRGLLAEGIDYCRYSDDFRIFCKTNRQAHEALALLANILFENHGLTLQQHKTVILPTEVFLKRFEPDLHAEWRGILARLDELGMGDPYGPVDLDALPDAVHDEVAALNLGDMLAEELRREEIDIPRTRFILKRMTQFGLTEIVDDMLKSIEKLYPVIPDVVKYVAGLSGLDQATKRSIGATFLDLAKDSTVAHLDFHRMWLLSIFTGTNEWDNESALPAAYGRATHDYAKRELIIALGVVGHETWFRTNKRSVGILGPWLKRAFIYGASCLPKGERHHWYRAIASQSDELERAVGAWAEDNPLG